MSRIPALMLNTPTSCFELWLAQLGLGHTTALISNHQPYLFGDSGLCRWPSHCQDKPMSNPICFHPGIRTLPLGSASFPRAELDPLGNIDWVLTLHHTVLRWEVCRIFSCTPGGLRCKQITWALSSLFCSLAVS